MQTGFGTTPVVILVNGASSSGKTTLCRALQERLTDLISFRRGTGATKYSA